MSNEEKELSAVDNMEMRLNRMYEAAYPYRRFYKLHEETESEKESRVKYTQTLKALKDIGPFV
jgi:hypothetical protein